jgi:hypothetical protein
MAEEIIPPISPRTRRRPARAELIVFGVAAVILILAQGPSIKRSGERMDPGVIRTAVLAVGKPADWIGRQLPFDNGAHTLTAWLSPDDDLASGAGGFAATVNQTSGVPPVTTDAFTPADLGEPPAPKRGLRKLLVTGDSMSQGLDAELARRLSDGNATQVVRDPHIGTGISKTDLVDWGKLSTRQTGKYDPDAIVMFIGANDGYSIDDVDCCSAEWAALYATRARTMMNTYRRDGDAIIYWLSLPLPRDKDLATIVRVVNAAVRAAATPYRRDVRILDMTTLFTPDGKYRDEMEVDGKEQLVRDADGIHLNDRGAELAADEVLRAVAQDFEGVDSP